MKIPKSWEPGTTPQEEANIAYAERNLLALYLGVYSNSVLGGLKKVTGGWTGSDPVAGWYYDTDNNWDGFKRVISLFEGKVTFHVPDDFDLGNLPEIEPNWDGHSTSEKWKRVMERCGCEIDE